MRPPAAFELRVDTDGGEARVAVSGELGLSAVRRLKREIARLREQQLTCVVLDLERVTAIDVVGVGAVLGADSSSSRAGQALEVIPPPAPAGTLLVLLGSSDRLRIRARDHVS